MYGNSHRTGRKHHSAYMQRLEFLPVALLIAFAAGCTEQQPAPRASEPDSRRDKLILAARFNPAQSGTIQGKVTWEGKLPAVAQIHARQSLLFRPPWRLDQSERSFPNPNVPRIEPDSHGVHGAVVYLQQVDPELSRQWDHGEVNVHYSDYRIEILQDQTQVPVGIARRGDSVAFLSKTSRFHIAQAHGANFFSLTMPKANQPRRRVLNQSGTVQLTSGAAYYWMRGYLFVADHPYFVCTDASGAFTLRDVPAGDYKLVAWLPNWKIKGYDYNPEMGDILRMHVHPPVTQLQSVQVQADSTSSVEFKFREEQFSTAR